MMYFATQGCIQMGTPCMYAPMRTGKWSVWKRYTGLTEVASVLIYRYFVQLCCSLDRCCLQDCHNVAHAYCSWGHYCQAKCKFVGILHAQDSEKHLRYQKNNEMIVQHLSCWEYTVAHIAFGIDSGTTFVESFNWESIESNCKYNLTKVCLRLTFFSP